MIKTEYPVSHPLLTMNTLSLNGMMHNINDQSLKQNTSSSNKIMIPQMEYSLPKQSNNNYANFIVDRRNNNSNDSEKLNKIESHTTLPPISSLIITDGDRRGTSSIENSPRNHHITYKDYQRDTDYSVDSGKTAIDGGAVRQTSYQSMDSSDTQNFDNKFTGNTPFVTNQPTILYSNAIQQPQNFTQGPSGYIQYGIPMYSKSLSSNYPMQQNFVTPNLVMGSQSGMIPNTQYITSSQPQLAVMTNNGLTTTMTPVNIIPQINQIQQQQYQNGQKPQANIPQGINYGLPQQPMVKYIWPPMNNPNSNVMGQPINPISTFTINENNINTPINSNRTSLSQSPSSPKRSLSSPTDHETRQSSISSNDLNTVKSDSMIPITNSNKHKINHNRNLSNGVTTNRKNQRSNELIKTQPPKLNKIQLPQIYTNDFRSAVKQRKQCNICGKICSRPSTLKTHYLIHTGDTPFKCTFKGCRKAFNVKSNMLRHLRWHSKQQEM